MPAAAPTATAWALALLCAVAAPAAAACAPPPGFEGAARVESGAIAVLFRTVPSPVEIGRHFSVEVAICADPPPAGIRVDAEMPAHRHGMNYRPRVTARGGGVYLAEGLLFHMPGRWQLLFDVDRGGRTERLAADMEIE